MTKPLRLDACARSLPVTALQTGEDGLPLPLMPPRAKPVSLSRKPYPDRGLQEEITPGYPFLPMALASGALGATR